LKRVLITGGAGYIGSVLVPNLVSRGFHVTVIDNFLYKQSSLTSCIRSKNLEVIYGDVRDKGLMKSLVVRADIVIPLAGIVGAPACNRDPITAQSTNVDSVVDMFQMISKNQQILMPTTNSAYGQGESEKDCDENSPLKPLSLYARQKVLIEERLMLLENATSFRLATVFGVSPRMRLDLLVNNFVYRAIKDQFIVLFEGNFRRNFIHLEDVVQAINLAIDIPSEFIGQIFNVGLSSANLTKIELCEEIKKHFPDFVYFEAALASDPDQRDYSVSNKKIEKTGFTPKKSLQDGILEIAKAIPMFSSGHFYN
jgi:nucleoside-diphosphate-sugar epimerase